MLSKNALKRSIIGLTLLWFILGIAVMSHCSTTKVPNSLGVVIGDDSPVSYLIGSPALVNVMEDNGTYYTNVTFKPLGSSMLDKYSVLFCGDYSEVFDGRLLALAYFRVASRAYKGIGCHNLYKVLAVPQGVR